MKKVIILGYGTVGSGVYELIERNKIKIKKEYNYELQVKKILIRNLSKYEPLKNGHLFTNTFEDTKKVKADIVIEAMGGIHPAYDYIKYFLNNGINVITANKDLISEHGNELIEISLKKNAIFNYEASVGGGIPVIKAIRESLGGNKFHSINAIINGTTNFILTKMHNENMSYANALSIAQQKGFAEANPEADVDGYDAVRKLAIISSLAYGKKIKWSTLPREGITNIDAIDIENAKICDAKIKLLAFSELKNHKFFGAVRPVFVNKASIFANIDNEYNGITLSGDAVGDMHFCGKGAGKLPTASAIFGDLIDILKGHENQPQTNLDFNYKLLTTCPNQSKWALRVTCNNKIAISKLLTDTFADVKIEFKSSENNILAIIEEKNEKTLLQKIKIILAEPSVERVKHFMMI